MNRFCSARIASNWAANVAMRRVMKMQQKPRNDEMMEIEDTMISAQPIEDGVGLIMIVGAKETKESVKRVKFKQMYGNEADIFCLMLPFE
ncbi:hypothetical protein QVD17_35300 [Tagetes erecta]|uniref:Uncharacterized protein n=1 Tax=Tagetes erecta TaxID=13708 RepID=A0AAD8JZ61_TARER|nr:hypothetical protein QVD17_35300 [Tagetes erecta]